MQVTNLIQELRLRTAIDCSHPKLTDQSFKKQCDINNIMLQYQKTGLLPNFQTKSPSFIDNTQIPDLNTAFELVNSAIDAFNQLPPDIRKLMDNNAANLESFISNEKNHDLLLKNGLIEKPKVTEKETTLKDINETLKKHRDIADKPANA